MSVVTVPLTIVRIAARIVRYVWFIKTYWVQQLTFNAQVFTAIVVYGQNFVKIEDSNDELLVVNNYHTRYEGTDRAA